MNQRPRPASDMPAVNWASKTAAYYSGRRDGVRDFVFFIQNGLIHEPEWKDFCKDKILKYEKEFLTHDEQVSGSKLR